jgi:hypothetical protein
LILLKLSPGLRCVLEWPPKKPFDKAIVAFPELAKQSMPAKSFEQIDLMSFRSDNKFLPFGRKRALFLSTISPIKEQKVFYKCVLYILNEMVDSYNLIIDIKTHPREVTKVIKSVIENEERNTFTLLRDNEVSAEQILLTSKYEMLIGISSSTLFYATEMKLEMEIYSISNVLKFLLMERGYTKDVLERMDTMGNDIYNNFNIKQLELEGIYYEE